MKMKVMKKDELLTLARHMKIRNKSTAKANELRYALREKGAIDDKDQITPVGQAALARKIWKKEDIKKELTDRGLSERSKTKIDDLVDLGVKYGFLDENYHLIGGQGNEASSSEIVELIPKPEIPVAYKKDELREIAKEAGLKSLQNTSQDRLLQILKDHNLVARNSVIAAKTRPDMSARLIAKHAEKRQIRAAAAAAAAAADKIEAGEASVDTLPPSVVQVTGYSSIKMSLNSFLTQDGYLLPICDAVNAMKKMTIEAYIFANLHVIRLLQENKPVCLLDATFFYNCLALVAGNNPEHEIPEMRESAIIYMKCRPSNYRTTDRSILGGTMKNCSLQMATATKNHVSMNLYKRMKRYCWLKFDMDPSEQYEFLKDIFDDKYVPQYGNNGRPIDVIKQHFIQSMPRPTTSNMQNYPERFMKVLWEIERFNRFDPLIGCVPNYVKPEKNSKNKPKKKPENSKKASLLRTFFSRLRREKKAFFQGALRAPRKKGQSATVQIVPCMAFEVSLFYLWHRGLMQAILKYVQRDYILC